MKAEIRALEINDLESLNQLFQTVFKVPRKPEDWKWKFFENPHGEPVTPVAVKDNEIVGFYGLLPRKTRFFDSTVTAYQEVDLMVHPDHGAGGLFKRLGHTAYQQVQQRGDPFTFGFPNQTSLPLGRRILGWRAIKPIPLWTMLLKPAAALKDKLPPIPGAGLCAEFFFRLYHRSKTGWNSSFKVDLMESPDGIFDSDFWNRGSFASDIRFIRDKDYLRWRYLDCPGQQYWTYACKTANGVLAGVAIAGAGSHGRANIVESWADPNTPGAWCALMGAVAADCRQRGFHTVRAWALEDNPEAKMFKNAGFLNRNALNYHVIRSFRSPEHNRLLWDPEKWYLTSGDSDCV